MLRNNQIIPGREPSETHFPLEGWFKCGELCSVCDSGTLTFKKYDVFMHSELEVEMCVFAGPCL